MSMVHLLSIWNDVIIQYFAEPIGGQKSRTLTINLKFVLEPV